MEIWINNVFANQQVSGQQRFAQEIAKRLGGEGASNIKFVTPPPYLANGLLSWLWVQTIGLRLVLQKETFLISLTSKIPVVAMRKQIVTVHDLFVLEKQTWFSSRYRLVHRYLLKKSLREAQAILVVSEATRMAVEQSAHYRGQHIQLVQNGVSAPRREESNELSGWLASVGLSPGSYIVCPNWWDPRKNLSGFLEVWRSLPRHLTSKLQLVCTGQPPRGVFAESSIEQEVRTVGYISDDQLFYLYRKAKFLAFPSLAEGFGLPPLEACLAGGQVLISDIPSLLETCGQIGHVLQLGSDQKCQQEVIMDAIHERKARLSDSEIEALATKYSWDQSSKKLIDFLAGEIQCRT